MAENTCENTRCSLAATDFNTDLPGSLSADLSADLSTDLTVDLSADLAPDLASNPAADQAADLAVDLAADLATTLNICTDDLGFDLSPIVAPRYQRPVEVTITYLDQYELLPEHTYLTPYEPSWEHTYLQPFASSTIHATCFHSLRMDDTYRQPFELSENNVCRIVPRRV